MTQAPLPTRNEQTDALVIGGGPAGLMAAEALLDAGAKVILAEAKPTVARKFLMAGKSGLNLTKSEPLSAFLQSYSGSESVLGPCLEAFGPDQVMSWAEDLGQDMFIGSSGRVFPKAMKASPLLRAWMARLAKKGLDLRLRHRWLGWDTQTAMFHTPNGTVALSADVTVLALGGASWSKLGSDGAWAPWLSDQGIAIEPFEPSNAGLIVPWSDHMAKHFGAPLKNINLSAGSMQNRGEVVISTKGLEGGGVYPLGPALRDRAELTIDLFPDLTEEKLAERLAKPRGKQSLSNHLRKTTKLSPAAMALVMELARPLPNDPKRLAETLKHLPFPYAGLRPLDEAISTTGGVAMSAVNADFMLTAKPGVFCAGEMLDWDAPTGGYLLTACLATGRWAGFAAAERLKHQRQ